MKSVFVSYAAEQENAAQQVVAKLRARDLEVFLAPDSLPAGRSYDERIREAIGSCDVFVFLVSPESLTAGRYTLTELDIAKKRWPNPAGHVLPVLVPGSSPVEHDPYLDQSVTMLKTRGSFAAEVAEAVQALLVKDSLEDTTLNSAAPGVAHSRRLRLRAETLGSPQLVPILERLAGLVLEDRYRVERLHEFGKQFAVYRGLDVHGEQPVAIKVPLVDYSRPVSYGLQEVRQARVVAEREFAVLEGQRPASPLPKPIALLKAMNPLHGNRGRDPGWNEELFLVQEWIEGVDLDSLRMFLFARREPPSVVEATVLRVARALLRALAGLYPDVFADPAPRNFLWCEEVDRVRIVDGSSLVTPGTRWLSGKIREGVLLPVTPAYLSGADHRAYEAGEPCVATEDSALFGVGKVLHQLATNLHPLEGEDPSLDIPEVSTFSRDTVALVAGLLHGGFTNTLKALEAIEGVCKKRGSL